MVSMNLPLKDTCSARAIKLKIKLLNEIEGNFLILLLEKTQKQFLTC